MVIDSENQTANNPAGSGKKQNMKVEGRKRGEQNEEKEGRELIRDLHFPFQALDMVS